MEEMTAISDVQQLYKQWQEGKLLDNEERSALVAADRSDGLKQSFSDVLKAAADTDTAS